MIDGHGDDLYRYGNVRINFSSNIPAFVDLSALEEHLSGRLPVIRSYPEPAARALEAAIARRTGRRAEEVLVTAGATEAIYLIAQALRFRTYPEETTCTVVHPTFSEYESACRMFGMREAADGDVCWLCNPNNPTGEVYAEADVRNLAARHKWLIVDQSYEDYTLSPLPRVDDLSNVMVLHSMTKKYCIPGLRLGYVTASAELIDLLRRQCRPWAVNALAMEAGLWLTEHEPRLIDLPAYLAEAQRLRSALNDIPGLRVRETQTNFMLCTMAEMTAAELKGRLVTRHGILIRDASNFRGLSPHHFRVAAQRPEENEQLLKALLNLDARIS
ncbi:MAG: aminotransferase class I/II-fold pyridoxal phosphate-dependent enzyme [Bacteroidaceae bacterium]|nr:aminotransferase class I/II-fold pyridoxal phosphate-dependent enzyme [Bacteroidaceae bacterium]